VRQPGADGLAAGDPVPERPMQYMILICGDQKAWVGMPQEETGKVFAAYMNYSKGRSGRSTR
jgi:hypothetical protein